MTADDLQQVQEDIAEAVESAVEDVNEDVAQAKQDTVEVIYAVASEVRDMMDSVRTDLSQTLAGLDTRIAALESDVSEPPATPEPSDSHESEPVELPEEVVKPRKLHPFTRLPRWI